MDKVKIAIIGGGVIGLAIAAELSRKHKPSPGLTSCLAIAKYVADLIQ